MHSSRYDISELDVPEWHGRRKSAKNGEKSKVEKQREAKKAEEYNNDDEEDDDDEDDGDKKRNQKKMADQPTTSSSTMTKLPVAPSFSSSAPGFSKTAVLQEVPSSSAKLISALFPF
jgi:hypothetical protein